MLILHSFWLSLATYRVRIALNLKGVAFEERAHDLSTGATRCHGEILSIADLALASHLVGAARFGVELDEFPRTAAVGDSLFAIPEFAAAHPRFQLGAPEG